MNPIDLFIQHPVLTLMVTLSLVVFPYEGEKFSTFGRFGVWWWDAEVDVEIIGGLPGERADVDDSDFDPFLGLGTQYMISPRFGLRLEYERYFLDDNDLDFASLGIVFNF